MQPDAERRPTLVLNPVDDERFAAAVDRLLKGGVVQPMTLQECLRQEYPLAVVHPRELAGEQTEIWYVYRDGHWIRPARGWPRP